MHTIQQLHDMAQAYFGMYGDRTVGKPATPFPVLDAAGIKVLLAHSCNAGLTVEDYADCYVQIENAPFDAWNIETAAIDAIEGLWIEQTDYDATCIYYGDIGLTEEQRESTGGYGVHMFGDIMVITGDGGESTCYWVFNRAESTAAAA